MAGDSSVFTYGKGYNKALQSFNSHLTELEVIADVFKKEMMDILKRNGSYTSDEPLRVLAVGTGDGNRYDKELLDILSKLNMKVHYSVVEPRVDAIDVFRDHAEKKYQNTQFEWIPTTFGNYQESEWIKAQKKFDLIHFIHSLYYFVTSFETLGSTLRPCYRDMLKDGGSIFTLVNNQKEKRLFYPQLPVQLYYFDSSDAVGELARHEGWNYKRYELNYQVDLTECFDDDSKTGGYILDFLTRAANFRQTSDKDQLDNAMRHLEKECELTEDGRKIATRCTDMTLIYKN